MILEILKSCAEYRKWEAEYRKWEYDIAVSEIERLRAQLPPEMQNCTIRFIECPAGHGRLTADNWVRTECQKCEINRLTAAIGNAIERAEQAEAENAKMMAMLGGDMGLKQLRAAEKRAEQAEAEVERLLRYFMDGRPKP